MAVRQVGRSWTVEHYLTMERMSTVKHEYHSGYVYAMAGGTQAHSVIAMNIGAVLRSAMRGTRCRVMNPDIKVRQTADDFVYPDAAVTCDPRDDDPERHWIEYPTLLVEVLSPSTERHDRTDKFEGYKAIATLREYVFVDYSRPRVDVWRRDEAGPWVMAAYEWRARSYWKAWT